MNLKRAKPHGSIQAAVNYLLGPRDAEGRLREAVVLLHGNPLLLVKVVNTLPYRHGYDSLIVSYAPDDRPSSKQIRQFVEQLTKVMFPGMRDRFTWIVVEHRDTESVHLHILAACVDLRTGKQFSVRGMSVRPAKLLCQITNFKNGWADPSDSFRARLAWYAKEVFIEETVAGQALPVGTEVHRHARALVITAVMAGRVANQSDVASVLTRIGTVERLGHHSITLSVPGIRSRGAAGTRVKFLGLLYSRKIDPMRILDLLAPSPVPQTLRRRNTDEEDRILAEELVHKLMRDSQRRAAALEERYALSPVRARRSLKTELGLQTQLLTDLPAFDVRRQDVESGSFMKLDAVTDGGINDVGTQPSDHGVHRVRRGPVLANTGARVSRTIFEAGRQWAGPRLAYVVAVAIQRTLGAAVRTLRRAAAWRDGLDRSVEPRGAFGAAACAATATSAQSAGAADHIGRVQVEVSTASLLTHPAVDARKAARAPGNPSKGIKNG